MPQGAHKTPSEVSQDPDEMETEAGSSASELIEPKDITPVSTAKQKAKRVILTVRKKAKTVKLHKTPLLPAWMRESLRVMRLI